MTTFHKIDRDSVNSISNALSFFDVPPTNVSVSSSSSREYLTLNPLSDAPYHFKIHASTNFIDLSKCYIFTEFRIRKFNAAGTLVNLDATDNVSVCQLLGGTFMKNLRIAVNGTQVFEGNSLMAYKTIFDYELTFPQAVKSSYLSVAGYYPDGDTQTHGPGYNSRKLLFLGSKVAQFICKIPADLFNQPRYLVNQCELDIEIQPNESNFLLISQPPAAGQPQPVYQLETVSCKLYVKTLELMDSLAFDISKKLELRPARYPIRKTSIKSLFISAQRTEFTANLWTDQVPRRIVLAMLSNANYIGSQTSSPFDFRHFNLRQITVTANGHDYPSAPYSFDFLNGRYARAFHDMQEAVGYAGSLDSNGISYEKYRRGWCFFVFNLTNSGEDSGAETFDLIKSGATIVRMEFSEAVPDGGIVLIAMGELDSLLFLDKNRVISSDYTV